MYVRKLLTLGIFLSLSLGLFAQERTITGTVVDGSDKSPLPGVSVLIKGTSTGAITDVSGKYRIIAPANATTLVFTFVGFTSQEVEIAGRSIVDVSLVQDTKQLEEVVVTAIGIAREKKALGYAVTTVGNELISNRPEADVSRVLQGKVAGVNITSTSGISGSGTNIIIRGYSSATGSNQPLFVVDGVPFNSNTNSQNNFGQGGSTTSSRFLDIDPNNIENVSVLKGLSATVLYGDQGRNGVILITTKSGSAKKRVAEVTLNQSYFQNNIASLPTYGDTYGNGFQQQPGFFFSNFGPRMDQGLRINHPIASSSLASIRNAFPQFFNQDGTPILYDYRAYDDPGKVFFRTGNISNTSIQINGSTDKTGISASFGYTTEEGFTPNNTLEKFNFGLGINSAVTDKLSINSSFTFAITDMATPPVNAAFGSGPNGGIPSIFAHVLYTPRSVDLGGLPFENPVDRSSVYFRSGNDIVNPRWAAKYYQNTSVVNRFFNSTSLNYDLNSDFSLTYRIGLDTYTEKQEVKLNKGGPSSNIATQNGYYRTVDIKNTIWNQDLILNYKKDLTDKFTVSALLGANTRYDAYQQSGIASVGQLAFGLFRHTNFENSGARDAFSNQPLDFFEEERRMGVYSTVTLDYGNYLFVNLVGRNDWTSTVEPENRRIFYPGASISFVPTDAFGWNNRMLNSLKVRAGYGTSAGFPPPYRTRSILNQNSRGFANNAGTLFPTHTLNTRLGNPNLKPELQQEFEFGLEGVAVDSRIRFDFSLYERNTRDLITSTPIDPSTGFTSTFLNIGRLRTRGAELQISGTPVQTKWGFSWETTVNYGMYRSVVIELGGGLDEVVVSGFADLGNFAIPGRPFNIIKGSVIDRDPQGNKIVLPTGDYRVAADLGEIGDPNPAWTGSWINTFRYKSLALNVMMEYRHKGVILSNTVTATLARGVTKDPVVDRELSLILPGVKVDPESGQFVPNDIQITASNYFFNGYHTGADEANAFDGSTIRLREISLSYDVPLSLVNKTPFKRASVSLSGTNLWFRALNFPPNMNFDTDVLSLGVGNGLGFDFVTGPSSRRFGGTLVLTF